MIYVELILFILLIVPGWVVVSKLWKWADIKGKIREIKEVESQYHTVSEFKEKTVGLKEKKETIETFKRQ